MLASAGVLGTLYADEIIMNGPLSQIGSIGVMMSIDKKVLKEIQKHTIQLYSENSERKNENFKALLRGDEQPLVNYLTDSDNTFMEMVKEARGDSMSKENEEEATSGAMFGARDGVIMGLAHGVGDMDYVLRRMQILVNNNSTNVQ